jgi:hypothetical protein
MRVKMIQSLNCAMKFPERWKMIIHEWIIQTWMKIKSNLCQMIS